VSLSSGDEVPHIYTKIAPTAKRIFDHQCKKTFATISAISGLMRCSKLRLLVDHLVCAGEPRRGKIEAEHSSGLEVDDQLVFGRRLQCEHFKQP